MTDLTMLTGETTTITISAYAHFGPVGPPVGGVKVISSDTSVLTLDQDPTLSSTNVTLHALQPGTAYIRAVETNQYLVTVDVGGMCDR